jgi:hypothetical protein
MPAMAKGCPAIGVSNLGASNTIGHSQRVSARPGLDEDPMWRAFFIAFGFVLLSMTSSHAASFDGTWSVLQVCDATTEGARGYTWRYDANVTDGHLVGQYRTKGQSPSLTLEGKIQPDGTASLVAKGISGDSDHNIKFAQPQSPILFRVTAKFEAAAGTGAREGIRSCKFTFGKH